MLRGEDGNPDVLLVNGYGFADAVSAGPLANGLEIPVLLTGRDELPFRTERGLIEGNVLRIYAIGGREAIGDEVLDRASRVGCPDEEPCREVVVRLGGADRYETSALVASYAAERFNRDLSTVHLVRGDTFPDALAAGVLAGKRRAVSLLTDPATLSGPTADWLRDHAADVMDVDVLGSPDAVADDVWDEARRLADG
jgi:putative cell wall-binding protein